MISAAAHNRLLGAASASKGSGMKVNVQGVDLNALLSAYEVLSGNGNAGVLEVRQALKEADEILRDWPELWGQPLHKALEEMHGDEDSTALTESVKACVGRFRPRKK